MEARLVVPAANLFNTRMYYLAVNSDTIGKFILRIIQNILMPGIRQKRQDLFSYHTLFHALNQLIKARYTAFDRRNNIACQHLRQIVEKAAEEIAHDTLITGSQLNCAKITHNRYQQYMPHNRGFRNTRRLRPTLLEAKLADKIDKLAALTLSASFFTAAKS